MKDWLIKRLTPRKKQEERWTGLAEGLQQVWEEDFDPALARLEGLRSYFGADDADLALKLREMGDYFAADMPRPEDRPIAVAWRRLELEYKDLELILYSVFRRHYSDLPVSWFPLFAPVDEPYGMRFTPAEGPWPETKNIPPDGMFLTSRGLLGTDYGHLLSIGLSKQEFLDKAFPLLKRTKPLHIVYDGPLWYIRFDIPFEAELRAAWERDCGIFEVPFAVIGSRFDFTPADAHALDIETVSCRWERDLPLSFPFLKQDSLLWHTDWNAPEGLPDGWLPLDFVLAGTEGEEVAPFRLYLADSRRAYTLGMEGLRVSLRRQADSHPRYGFSAATTAHNEIDRGMAAAFSFGRWRIDAGIPEIPDGWLSPASFPGREGEMLQLVCFSEQRRFMAVPATRGETSLTVECDPCMTTPAPFVADIEAPVDKGTESLFATFGGHNRLDRFPRFDECPADCFPLDMPIGGAYA